MRHAMRGYSSAWWQEIGLGVFTMIAAIGYSLPQIKKRMDKHEAAK
jgi:hypothetical protein